jgi:predicted dehydrogenase
MKTAIVGCGKIADAHAEQISRIPGALIVGACDTEQLMVNQFCDRYGVTRAFTDVRELIAETRPEVVHITTPPVSHYPLAKTCLDAGCHVYVEKPFTVTLKEAQQLIAAADDRRRKITVGHDAQFNHATRRMRALVKEGYLGGPPIHMESYYCYAFGGDAYARALLGDKNHWVRKLPGGLPQNIISHGISSLAEFLVGDNPDILTVAFTSPFLKSIGVNDIADELRVIITDDNGTTAYFTFSSQMRPSLHQFRIYGPKNGILVDDDKQTVIRLSGTAYKSYAEKFIPPVTLAKQYIENAAFNVKKFIQRDFHMKSGMKFLIESFYKSVRNDTPVPISYREITLTARIMEDIVLHLRSETPSSEPDTSAVPA